MSQRDGLGSQSSDSLSNDVSGSTNNQSTFSQQVTNIAKFDEATVEEMKSSGNLSMMAEGESPLFPTATMVDESATLSMPFRKIESQGHASMHLLETERMASEFGKTEAPFDIATRRRPEIRVVSEGVFTKTLSNEVFGKTKGEVSSVTVRPQHVPDKASKVTALAEDTPSVGVVATPVIDDEDHDPETWGYSETLGEETGDGEVTLKKNNETSLTPNKQKVFYAFLVLVFLFSLVWLLREFM